MTTSVLDICEWSATQPELFAGKSHPVPVLWTSLRTQKSLATFCPVGKWKPESSAVQLVASHYTD